MKIFKVAKHNEVIQDSSDKSIVIYLEKYSNFLDTEVSSLKKYYNKEKGEYEIRIGNFISGKYNEKYSNILESMKYR